MVPIMFPGLTQPTLPAASAPASAAGTAHRRRRARRGVFAAPPLIAVLLLVLCSCGTAQAAPSRSHVGSAEQLTSTRSTSRLPRLTETFVSPTIVEVSQRWRLIGGNGVAAATCPTGDYALGGGWVVPDTQAMVTSAQVSGASWRVGLRGIGHPVLVYATAYVECLAGSISAVVTQRSFSLEVQPNSRAAALASCSADETLVGSGFDLSQSNGSLEVRYSEPLSVPGFVPPDWYIAVQNHNSIVEQFSYSVECLSDVMALTYPLFGSEQVSVTPTYPVSVSVPVASDQTETVSVDCPAGYEVAGGGFAYLDESDQGQNDLGNLYLQHTTATGWQGALYNVPDYGPATFELYVTGVCLDFV